MEAFRFVRARWNDRKGDIKSPVHYLHPVLMFLAWLFLGRPMRHN